MTDERIEKLERFGFVWFPWGNDSDVSVGWRTKWEAI
jgi:hypothetical protein